MASDKQIWLSAQSMIDRFGDGALIEINKRISELEMNKKTRALAMWIKIRAAAEALLEGTGENPIN